MAIVPLGRSQDFQRGGVDFLLKRAKQGASEVSVAYVGGFWGEAPEDGNTFVATNFLISLFLFFPLYYFYFILLASQRASLAKGGHWLRACVYRTRTVLKLHCKLPPIGGRSG